MSAEKEDYLVTLSLTPGSVAWLRDISANPEFYDEHIVEIANTFVDEHPVPYNAECGDWVAVNSKKVRYRYAGWDVSRGVHVVANTRGELIWLVKGNKIASADGSGWKDGE